MRIVAYREVQGGDWAVKYGVFNTEDQNQIFCHVATPLEWEKVFLPRYEAENRKLVNIEDGWAKLEEIPEIGENAEQMYRRMQEAFKYLH